MGNQIGDHWNIADAITNNGGCYCGDTTVRAKYHQMRSWPVITPTAKTLFMIHTGCLDQRHELVPAKHIFGKSAVERGGEIANSPRVAEGPASGAMTPFKKA